MTLGKAVGKFIHLEMSILKFHPLEGFNIFRLCITYKYRQILIYGTQ